jgi:SAM-dependent methyltransferase
LKTVKNFSYQWKRFNKMLPIYEMNHRLYFHPRGKEFFAGKLGLDAGCGTGRHVYYAAKSGAEMVAIDLSEAVGVAYQNTESLENVHVAQADIYDLPFKRDYFDFVESVGVIHILPDPKAAFDELVKRVRPGGEIFIYVYSSNSIVPQNRQEAIRMFIRRSYERIGRRLPRPALYACCYVTAVSARMWNVPLHIMQRWGPTRRLATQLIAFRSYEIYPLYVLHTDLFDWIGTPLNRYYTLDEVRSFYTGGPYDRVEIQEAQPQWRVFARKTTTPEAGVEPFSWTTPDLGSRD